ncbi:hypothetical protein BAUCODRAFT_405709 [Baudoinia panamericana UAMH 10762]|uniref:Uncharacterized protein n=1 Tax=Baudoinia panamericana (strain UAMH 10762) TaxID=717646 RepID=M2NF10_BAUPA|nr:uncharacterized protein BAUCODRAFT_405709 [Baudoinia panamericana UAMH 10762]EMC97844.1 hypothetical protein BAUCODRAFT_405709 [Baudoinia panamericana UAMH 10762]
MQVKRLRVCFWHDRRKAGTEERRSHLAVASGLDLLLVIMEKMWTAGRRGRVHRRSDRLVHTGFLWDAAANGRRRARLRRSVMEKKKVNTVGVQSAFYRDRWRCWWRRMCDGRGELGSSWWRPGTKIHPGVAQENVVAKNRLLGGSCGLLLHPWACNSGIGHMFWLFAVKV